MVKKQLFHQKLLLKNMCISIFSLIKYTYQFLMKDGKYNQLKNK